jgi:hypothetical protein
MPQTSDGNVHAPQYREAKPSQGDPSRPVSQLFRLDDRMVIGESTACPMRRTSLLNALTEKVTGATGFLGSTLAITMLESGADVVCLDLPPTPTAQNWSQYILCVTRCLNV